MMSQNVWRTGHVSKTSQGSDHWHSWGEVTRPSCAQKREGEGEMPPAFLLTRASPFWLNSSHPTSVSWFNGCCQSYCSTPLSAGVGLWPKGPGELPRWFSKQKQGKRIPLSLMAKMERPPAMVIGLRRKAVWNNEMMWREKQRQETKIQMYTSQLMGFLSGLPLKQSLTLAHLTWGLVPGSANGFVSPLKVGVGFLSVAIKRVQGCS